MDVPRVDNVRESIRNLYYHVPMWFGMVFLMLTSVVYSILYLKRQDLKYDIYAVQFANTAIVFGILGLTTGMIWAHFTWGYFWSNDPKQVNAAIALLIYFGYLLMRGSIVDDQQRAQLSAVFNIFAFSALVALLFIVPRLTDSLHPGSDGGNPGFDTSDVDTRMRIVFWPAVAGFTLLGVWITSLHVRITLYRNKILGISE